MKAAISIVVSNADRNAAGCLTWDMCREMSDSGSVEIDSHTYNLHNPETSGVYISDGANGIQRKYCESISSYYLRVICDIEKSYQRINDEIGLAPAMLAYPYGISDRWALECAHRLFSVTAVTQNNIADLSNGPYELSRFSVNMNVSLSDILNN